MLLPLAVRYDELSTDVREPSASPACAAILAT
jgi:hypothetical protein